MAARMDFVVLDVGQGSGNFIEIYDDTSDTVPAHTALIDLGFIRSKPKETLRYVVNKLNSMDNPTIDVMILTHGDADHHNLIQELLKEFSPPLDPPEPGKKALTIKDVFYAGGYGAYKKKRRMNTLTALKKYCTAQGGLTALENNESSFVAGQSAQRKATAGDAEFYWLIGNTVATETEFYKSREPKNDPEIPIPIQRNVVSAMVIVRYKDVGFLATGDATALTLAKANEILGTPGSDAPRYMAPFMMTVPHHGAAETIENIHGITTKEEKDSEKLAWQNLAKFVDNVHANTISVSAGFVYSHPSAKVLQYYWGKLVDRVYFADPDLQDDYHFYTAYLLGKQYRRVKKDDSTSFEEWPKRNGWYTILTSANIFTTRYYSAKTDSKAKQVGILPPEPVANPGFNVAPAAAGKSWIFRVDANGNKSVMWLPPQGTPKNPVAPFAARPPSSEALFVEVAAPALSGKIPRRPARFGPALSSLTAVVRRAPASLPRLAVVP